MNENFIEEENTIYEIDPDCQIQQEKGEKNGWKGQSFSQPFCLNDCRKERDGEENTENKRESNKKIRREKSSMNGILLLILLLCHKNLK